MGAFSDYVSADAPAAPAAPDETLGDFSGGLRRGLRSGGAAFNRVAGTAAEAMGFDGFARGRIAAAQAADAENAADPAKVSSYKDVIGAPDFSTGLRRAVDYGSNMLGESVPALGAMAVGGALGGMRGAAAGMLPFSMGDVAARQEADPVASQESAGLRLGKQALFGGADAVLNTIVPASVASRVVGKAATAAAQLPVSQILGRVGADAVAQGAAGAAGEAVKQVGVNPTKTLDMDQIGEVAVGGTALGAAMGGVGAAGTLARKAAGAPGRAVGGVVDAVGASAPVKALKDAVGPEGYDLGGKAAALMPGADGGIDLGGIAKGVRDTAADAAEKSTDYFKSVAEGKEDLNPLKGKTPEEVLAMMPGLDAERVKRVAEAATDVLNSAISPETRKAVSAAAANAADKASQQIIASAKLAKDAAVDLGQKLDAGLKAMAARKPATDLGVKKSEDYSGLRAAINEHVIPALPRSALLGLDAPSTNKLINQAGDLLRMLLEAAARKNEAVLPDGTLQYVMDVFGDKTPQVLAAVYKATRSDPRTSPAEANAVFGTINRIREMQKSQADLADVLSKNVREELQDSVTTGQVKRDAMWLRKYVEYAPKSVRPRDKGGKSTTAEAMSEEERFNHAEIRDHFEARYGKNFEVVLAAAEKEFKATQKTRNQFDDGSETVDGADRQLSDEVLSEDADPTKRKPVAQTPDPVYRGEGGKDEFMLLAPEKAVGKGGFASATQQAIDAMTARYPDRNVTFLRASEIGDHPAKTATLNKLIEQSFKDHPEMSQADRLKLANEQLKDYGFVVAEGSRQETSMTERDLKGVKLKRPEGSSADYKHPSRIDVGGEVLDAIKLSKWAEARNKDVQDYSNADNKSGLHRAGRMFMEGLAAAHARIGKPMKSDTIPDATQIGWHADGKTPLTWGEVKGLDYSPEKSASAKAFEARLAALREEYKNGDEYERAATLRKVRDLHDQEVGGRDETRRWRGDDRYDAEGRLTDEGARVLMQGDVDGGMEVERKTTHTDSVDEDQKVYTSEAITRAYLKDRGKSRAQREANKEPGDGRTEVDPFGPTHDVLRGRDEVPGAEIRTNLTGNSRQVDEGLGGSPMPRADAGRKPGLMSDATKQLLIDKVEAMQRNYTTAAGQAVAKRALALMDRIDSLPPPAHRALVSLLAKGTKMSDVAEVVNRLMPEKVEPKPVERMTPEAAVAAARARADKERASRASADRERARADRELAESVRNMSDAELGELYVDVNVDRYHASGGGELEALTPFEEAVNREYEARRSAKRASAPNDKAKRDAVLDKMLAKEDYSALTTPGKTNAFLKRAYERYGELMAMGDAKWDNPAFDRLAHMFDPGTSNMDLASLFEDFDGTRGGGMTDAEIRAKLKAAAPEVAANLPKAGTDRQAAVRAGPQAEAALDQANYSSMTKKFSKMGLQIHTELGRDGFSATHDSPIRHEGKFDWRSHAGNGEGNAAFGAGTYLSTADGVHRAYKGQFTAKVSSETSRHPAVMAAREALNRASEDVISLMQERDELGPWRAVVGRTEHFASKAEAQAALDKWTAERRAKIADYAAKLREPDRPGGVKYNRAALQKNIDYLEGKLRDDAGNKPVSLQDEIDAATERGRAAQAHYDEVKSKYAGAGYRGDKSPTYEVSVSIGEDSLLDWDKPLHEQNAEVRAKLMTLTDERKVELDWERDESYSTGEVTYSATDGGSEYTLKAGRAGWTVFRNDHPIGSGKTLAEAKSLAEIKTGADIYYELNERLGSQRAASEALQAAGILGHRYASGGGKNDAHPNYVIYDDSKITTNYVYFDKTNSNPSASPRTAQQDAALNAYLDKVLGPTIARDLNANIPHAGEFVKAGTQHLINISRFAMDPWGTGHHEALHSFFASMREASPTGEVARVLERAASSAPVMNQLRRLLKDHPEALKQLSDPEEAAAYMYQFWAAKKLTVGTQTHTIFSRIAAAVRRVLGIWSNDERALHILDYFHRGDFAVDRGQPDVVAQKLLLEHRNVLVDQAAKLTKPLRELSSSVAVAGGQQLRDSGIPALAQLADVIKLHGTSEGKDPGYMPAARAEHTRVMNEVMNKLAPFTAAQMREALDAMQQGVKAVSKEARQIQLLVQNPKVGLLPKMREYMGNAGVDVSQFGPDPTYFHRVWDTGFIAAHEKEFMAMLGKYQISGDLKGDPRVILQNLMATDGLEFRVETNMPGMQALKMRKLGFITGADAEPFLRKDLLENLNSYVQQATRRAEWARRLGDQGEGLQDLLTKAAKQGATPEQLAVAQRYVKSIDGTLGDTIDPKYRRLFGNMMVYQNIRLLPLAIFSSLPDSLGIMVRGGTVAESGRAFLRGMREIRKNFQKEGGKNDAATDLAELIGTIDSAQLMHTIGTSYSQGMVGNTGRRVNDLFFRFNFMDQYNRSMRVAATEAAINFIKRHADGKANKHSERWLAEIGLEAGAVKLDAEGRPDVTDPDVRMAINRWVDGAVLRPDAADAPPWMADPRAALIAHLKKFTFSFQETILKRVAHEYRHGNYAPAMALTSYVPMMLAADMAKGIIQGGGEEPDWKAGWDVGDYLGHAVQRAGLFGVGQFALDTYQGAQRDGPLGALGALGGPTVGQLTDGVEMLAGTQRPGTFLLNSMPANALYSEMARDGGGSGLGAGHARP